MQCRAHELRPRLQSCKDKNEVGSARSIPFDVLELYRFIEILYEFLVVKKRCTGTLDRRVDVCK